MSSYYGALLIIQIRYERHKSANLISTRNFAAVLPGDSVAGIVVTNGILNFLNLYNTVLIVRLVLTWFPNAPSAIVAPLRSVSQSFLYQLFYFLFLV